MTRGSVIVKHNPVLANEQFNLELDAGKFLDLRTSHRDQGGYYQADFEIVPRSHEWALDFLNNGLGRHVEVYGDHGNLDWEGFVNTVELSTGTADVSNSLNDMANKVWARFTPVGGGNVQRSTVFQNAESQARFGIKEYVISAGEVGADTADQLAELYLNENYWPRPTLKSIDTGGSLLSVPSLKVKCAGYIQTFAWRTYNQTILLGEANANTVITAIVTACGQFVQSTAIDTNNTQVTQEVDADRYADGMISAISDLGDVNLNVWVYGCGPQREFYFTQGAPPERLT